MKRILPLSCILLVLLFCVPLNSQCPLASWFQHNHYGSMTGLSSCFVMVQQPLTWGKAEKYCQEHYTYVTHLGTFLDFDDLTYFANTTLVSAPATLPLGELVWFGLQDFDGQLTFPTTGDVSDAFLHEMDLVTFLPEISIRGPPRENVAFDKVALPLPRVKLTVFADDHTIDRFLCWYQVGQEVPQPTPIRRVLTTGEKVAIGVPVAVCGLALVIGIVIAIVTIVVIQCRKSPSEYDDVGDDEEGEQGHEEDDDGDEFEDPAEDDGGD